MLLLLLFACTEDNTKKHNTAESPKDAPADITHPFGTETRYQKLAVGSAHTCALRMTGEIDCFGDNEFGEATPPDGKFIDVMTGINNSCAIRETGEFICWGMSADRFGMAYFRELYPQNPPFQRILIDARMVCTLDEKKMAHCFARENALGQTNIEPSYIPVQGPLEQFSMKNMSACGVWKDGSGYCWGINGDRRVNGAHPNQPDESWKFIKSAYYNWAIGVTQDGLLKIWGRDGSKDLRLEPEERTNPKTPKPMQGAFIDADINGVFHCGRDQENIVHCRINFTEKSVESTPKIPFISWGLGAGYGCGLDEQNIVHCWSIFPIQK